MSSALPRPEAKHPTAEEERQITREVLQLTAILHPLRVENGRIVIPEDATPELRERILQYEGELLWVYGYESGPVWGRAIPGCPYNTEAWPFSEANGVSVGPEQTGNDGARTQS